MLGDILGVICVGSGILTEALDVYIYEVLPITNNCLELYQKLIDEQVTLSTELTRANTSKGPMYTSIILVVICVGSGILTVLGNIRGG